MASKKYFISFVLTAMLLTSIPAQGGAAAATALVLDSSVKYAGDAVNMSGTSSFNEVVVKVVRPDGTILYMNIVKVTQGKYQDHFTLPADAASGIYTVITGQGSTDDSVANSTFTVKSKSDGGGHETPGSGPSGSGSGSDSIPSKPPVVDHSLPSVIVTDKSITTAIPTTAMSSTKVKENGTVISNVTVDQGALTRAFQALNGYANEKGKDLIIAMTVPRETGGTKIELPVPALMEGQRVAPTAMLSIQAGVQAIEMPIQAVDVPQLEKSLGAAASDLMLVVSTQSLPGLFTPSERQEMTSVGTVLLSDPAAYSVFVAAKGKQAKLDRFDDRLVRQTLTLSSKVDARSVTIVAIDPKTHELRFVPAVFQTTADGGTIATFKGRPEQLYMLISSRRTFADTAGHWAQSAIEHLASKQIVHGNEQLMFNPSGQITRAEFTALLVRSLGVQSSSTQPYAFKDVQVGDWYADAVQTASALGLVDGLKDGRFQPQAPVTREQMAVMMDRALKHLHARPQASQLDLSNRYDDMSDISGWAKDAMEMLVEEKLIKGVSAERIAPKRATTRAEAVLHLERFLQYAKLIQG